MTVNHVPTGANNRSRCPRVLVYVCGERFRVQRPERQSSQLAVGREDHFLAHGRTLTDNGVTVTAGQFVSASDISSGLLKFSPAAGAVRYRPMQASRSRSRTTAARPMVASNLDPSPKTITFNVVQGRSITPQPAPTTRLTMLEGAQLCVRRPPTLALAIRTTTRPIRCWR